MTSMRVPNVQGFRRASQRKMAAPGLVSLSGGTIKLSQRVYFKHNRDTIQKSSYPLLLAVATLMKAKPDIGASSGKATPTIAAWRTTTGSVR